MAFRVPTLNVSVVDLTVKLRNQAKFEEVCKAIKHASENDMKVYIINLRVLWDTLMKKLLVKILFNVIYHLFLIKKPVNLFN